MQDDDRQLLQEIADRMRRTETRVTKIANAVGIDAGGNKPVWNAPRRRVMVPSRKVALDDVMGVVPEVERCPKGVDVFCGEDYLMSLAWP